MLPRTSVVGSRQLHRNASPSGPKRSPTRFGKAARASPANGYPVETLGTTARAIFPKRRSLIAQRSPPHFDLSGLCANLETWLRVYGRSINDMAIFKVKPRSVIWTFNAVTH